MLNPFRTLRTKILFGMLLSLVPMIIIIGTTYYYFRNTTVDHGLKIMELIVQQGALEINEFIANQKETFMQLTRDDTFGIAIEFETIEEFEMHFESILNDYKGFSGLYLLDKKGRVLISRASKDRKADTKAQKQGEIFDKIKNDDPATDRQAFLMVDAPYEIDSKTIAFSFRTKDSQGKDNGVFLALLDHEIIEDSVTRFAKISRKHGILNAHFMIWDLFEKSVFSFSHESNHDILKEQAAGFTHGLEVSKTAKTIPFSSHGKKHLVSFQVLTNPDTIFKQQKTGQGKLYLTSVFPEKDLLSSVRQTLFLALFIGFVGVLLISLLSFFVLKEIRVKFNKFLAVFERMSQGDIKETLDIQGEDEIAEAADSFNRLVLYLQAVVDVCEGIGQNEFRKFDARSDNDVLGHAIVQMTSRLKKITQEQSLQDWYKTGQAELNNLMRGEQSPSALASGTVSYLARYIDAQIGAIYLVGEDNLLCLRGSYAFQKRKHLSGQFKPGEGLIGQAALEKDYILISNAPDDYILVGSGLGQASPGFILAMPFLYDGVVKGVMEFGSFEEFSDRHIDFLKSVEENLAVNFITALSRLKMADLLKKTTQQAEELKDRQQALENSNAELESQTALLTESEARLKVQQDALKVTNEELEEKSRVLEEQKQNIEKQNIKLQSARNVIEEKAKDLETANKYKSEFLANMSHELRTPLNSILLLSNLLSKNKNQTFSQKEAEYCQTINQSGQDLLSLINDILDLSKVEAGRMEIHIEKIYPMDFTDYIQRNFSHLAKEKGISIQTSFGDNLPDVFYSDRQRLEQIIKNLISNAIKFTQNGSVTIRIEQPAEKRKVGRMKIAASKSLAISVIDTGVGIAEDKRDIIFEAFRQEDGTTVRKYGGTGLGLSISTQLADLLEGEIDLQSQAGKGSTFTLYLPIRHSSLLSEPAPAKKDAPVKTLDHPHAKESVEYTPKGLGSIMDDRRILSDNDFSILIIDDDPKFARVLFDLAHERQFKCIVAQDGETGLQMADQYSPSAIILDVGLPGIDGWEVMTRLQKNRGTRQIPVHFISAHEKKQSIKTLGALGFLKKPVSLDTLEATFKKIESKISKTIKQVVLVGDQTKDMQAVKDTLDSADIKLVMEPVLENVETVLDQKDIDCVVIVIDPQQGSDRTLLAGIKKKTDQKNIPMVIYSISSLDDEHGEQLTGLTDVLISKSDDKAMEKLLDEISLFLHRVEKDIPEKQKKMMARLYEKETVFEGKKILVVDDDMRNVFALMNILEDKQVDVVVAKNGAEALEKLETVPDIDLVLMDIMMPVMDGYQAMTRIREMPSFKDLPIIALTAKTMRGDRDKCIEYGASDYIPKPIDIEKLMSLLRVWLYG